MSFFDAFDWRTWHSKKRSFGLGLKPIIAIYGMNEDFHRFPTNPLSFLFSPITKGFIRHFLPSLRRPVKVGDETVWEFVLRRFNYDVARLFFDPMVVGIFGGDIRKISVRACFPKLKAWEEKYGSITKGFYQARKSRKRSGKSPGFPRMWRGFRCLRFSPSAEEWNGATSSGDSPSDPSNRPLWTRGAGAFF